MTEPSEKVAHPGASLLIKIGLVIREVHPTRDSNRVIKQVKHRGKK